MVPTAWTEGGPYDTDCLDRVDRTDEAFPSREEDKDE